ncbi:hypothetical protein Glove_269g41 [Diversispora epigaea]|uniref:Uncharacterized protein n=1 Tax=Diversispora epigaea TaxID=1348612 RepID=A0A397I4L1_9GLOM|nr:hypothetical protein Glove_269g41 [Diversispora epigaea]
MLQKFQLEFTVKQPHHVDTVLVMKIKGTDEILEGYNPLVWDIRSMETKDKVLSGEECTKAAGYTALLRVLLGALPGTLLGAPLFRENVKGGTGLLIELLLSLLLWSKKKYLTVSCNTSKSSLGLLLLANKQNIPLSMCHN